ncbi:MAG: hypothetical protein Q8N23_19610 [Archangium sp.]|nr:hypothetical protein [Archangium sp.]MDP3154895.1 hypothetical protein [Archangium sp.]MDP3576014.1 hypothetical protein [Archangium sp.]
MIGSPLNIGRVSETVPVAPRADVQAPLVMERVLPGMADDHLVEEANTIVTLARALPAPWQRLVNAAFSSTEAHVIYERFVGVTLRDLTGALRTSGRVLPLDVLRSVIENLCDGLSALPPGPECIPLSDLSVGLSIDGRWRFAQGALNHWLINVMNAPLAEESDGEVPLELIFQMSPESIQGRAETAASLVTRVTLFAWQVAAGGHHPYRGRRHDTMYSITRYTRDEVRVPLSVHPELPSAVADVLRRGLRFSRDRFADLSAFRAALEPTWPVPAASTARTFDVIASLTWAKVQKELQLLKREPLLPIRWQGVWSGAQTPEQGIAVLEDQLLERLAPVEGLPRCGAVEELSDPAPVRVEAVTPPQRWGLFQRFLALFGR